MSSLDSYHREHRGHLGHEWPTRKAVLRPPKAETLWTDIVLFSLSLASGCAAAWLIVEHAL